MTGKWDEAKGMRERIKELLDKIDDPRKLGMVYSLVIGMTKEGES